MILVRADDAKQTVPTAKVALVPHQIFCQFPISKIYILTKRMTHVSLLRSFPQSPALCGLCVISSTFHEDISILSCVTSHTSRFADRGKQLNEYNIQVKIFHRETSFQGMTQQSIFISSD